MIAFNIVVGEEPIPSDWVEVEYTTDPLQKWRLHRRPSFNESRRLPPRELPPPTSRDVERRRRKRAVRAKTMNFGSHRGYKKALVRERELYPEAEAVHASRPKTRGECAGGPRPCPFVSCRYHLALEVCRNGNVKLNFPDIEVWEMSETCALDIADRGPAYFETCGELLNLTLERIRQIEERACARLREHPDLPVLRELLDPGVPGRVVEPETCEPEFDGGEAIESRRWSYHFAEPATSVSLDDSLSPFERGDIQVYGR